MTGRPRLKRRRPFLRRQLFPYGGQHRPFHNRKDVFFHAHAARLRLGQ